MAQRWRKAPLALVVLLSIVALAQNATIVNDAATLQEFAASIENWDEFSTANNYVWNSSLPTCVWKGVTCSFAGRIQALTLQCSGCSVLAEGTVPASLSQLDALETLNLQFNEFTSSLPEEWGTSGAFPVMRNMFLSNNNFTGTVPESWGAEGALPNLQLLRLDSNALTGSLPAWNASSLPALLVLRLFDNRLEGTLPISLGDMSQVQILSLQNNRLTGTVPSSWQFAGLQELYLQDNDLEGGLPSAWGSNGTFASLQILMLDDNDLGGSLPISWGLDEALPTLRTLSLSNVGLSGTLPSEWGTGTGLNSLTSLAVQGNALSGFVPSSWAQLSSLQRLVVRPGNEELCGPLPGGSAFVVCSEAGANCTRSDSAFTGSYCAGLEATPPPPASPDSGTGSSFPVAAVVAPIVAVLALGAAAALCLVLRRRRRRAAAVEADAKAAQVAAEAQRMDLALGTGGHPFDTGEGQRAYTSPFLSGMPPGGMQHMVRNTGSSAGSFPGGSRGGALRTPHSSGSEGGHTQGTRSQAPSQGTVGEGTLAGASFGAGSQSMSGEAVGSPLPTLMSTMGSKNPDWPTHISGSESSKALDSGMLFSDWEIFPNEVEIVKRPDGSPWQLGSGGFGTVYKALRNGVQPVAVKMLSAVSGDVRQAALEDFRKEISILKACRDLNIVQFVGASLGPDNTMLVTEYCEGGNLCNNIAAGRVTWFRRGRKIALDVAKALVFLHSRRIVHFDLKSPNILLARDGTAKISDVGMAKILNRDYITGAVGTLAWAAPEMLWGERCSEKADIYSYGIVLWEMCTGEKPVRGQLRDVVVPSECPESVRTLILECLETRPTRRPSALQIVERLVAGGGDPPEAGTSAPGSVGPEEQLRRAASGGDVGPPGAPPRPPPRAWLSQSGARDLRSAGAAGFSRPLEGDVGATGNSVHSV
uniref:Protein kinase domain-containing protein n=2 Tax=Auxenochlorella protothecoides TaxID=3075 RepID=A0A1D2A5N4_AUXPR